MFTFNDVKIKIASLVPDQQTSEPTVNQGYVEVYTKAQADAAFQSTGEVDAALAAYNRNFTVTPSQAYSLATKVVNQVLISFSTVANTTQTTLIALPTNVTVLSVRGSVGTDEGDDERYILGAAAGANGCYMTFSHNIVSGEITLYGDLGTLATATEFTGLKALIEYVVE